MTISPNSELLKRGEKRWKQIHLERPDLDPAIDLQRTLVARVIEIESALKLDELTVTPSNILKNLKRGFPVLRDEVIPIPVSKLGSSISDFCNHLADGGAGEVAIHIRDALEAGRIDTSSLLNASLTRDQNAIRTKAVHMGLAPDLLWLVAEMTIGPLAYLLQRRCFDQNENTSSGHVIAEALKSWNRGYCPACGSWPALMEIHQDNHSLRCSFCGANWKLRSDRCTYCAESDKQFLITTPNVNRPGRQLALCGKCLSYLKHVEVPDITPFSLLPIEDLASSDLDVIAMDQGYMRPSLPEIENVRDL